MSFIPKDYDKASPGDYMNKFQDGPNKIRFLKGPITGYEHWVTPEGNIRLKKEQIQKGDKPVRVKDFTELDMEARNNMKGFCAAYVWNYNADKAQVLQLNQVTIMRAFDALAESPSWGDITGYDVVVTRTKTGSAPKDVEYSVMPEAKAPLMKEITEMSDIENINLEALYEGEDPFEREMKMMTEDPITNEDLDNMAEKIGAKKSK